MAELATLALGKLAPKGSPGGEEPLGIGENEGLRMAMEDFLEAFRTKNTDAMASAFEDAVSMCRLGD